MTSKQLKPLDDVIAQLVKVRRKLARTKTDLPLQFWCFSQLSGEIDVGCCAEAVMRKDGFYNDDGHLVQTHWGIELLNKEGL